jgi:hypothetical protein
VPGAHQRRDQRLADEAGCTRDENPHPAPFVAKRV